MFLGAVVIVVVGLLVVNYFKGLDTGVTLPVGEQTEQAEGPTITREGRTFHIVQTEENLWKISERYYDSGYNWIDIAKVNDLRNPNLIEEGQELAIPNVEPKQPTIRTIEEKPLSPITGATYTVVKGENLWNIALRAYGDGYKWVDIARENKLVNPNIIHPGNILTLPR